MKDLNLPVPEEPLPKGKHLSMDEYLRFVQMQREHEFEQSKRSQRQRLPEREYERFHL